jgi:hypothetical protein
MESASSSATDPKQRLYKPILLILTLGVTNFSAGITQGHIGKTILNSFCQNLPQEVHIQH